MENFQDFRYRSDIYSTQDGYLPTDIEQYNENDKYSNMFSSSMPKLNKTEFNSYSPSINIEITKFIKLYFSNQNIQNLQNQIRYEVYNKSNKRFIINEQKVEQIGIIMESMYYQYSSKPMHECQFKHEIERLNQLVINYAVSEILSAIELQNAYIKKITSDVIPLDNGVISNKKGNYLKTYNPGLTDDF